jgi:succinylarginine dihydrolase
MAKQSKGGGATKQHQTHDQRPKRGKTPAQQAKRDRNIAEAQDRLRRLQDKQRYAKRIRSTMGYTGTDDQVIAKAAAEAERLEAAAYVKSVLQLPNVGRVISRWLAIRITMDPVHVKGLIERFLNRDGQNHENDNRAIKATVEAALAQPAAKAA